MPRRTGKLPSRAKKSGLSLTAPALLYSIAIVLLTLVCFWPLTRFYFAQDDFVFLERASQGFGAAVGGFFTAHAGQFRPLTKGVYFLATWPMIGLHPAAYHVLSILLHALNALLLGVLLLRMGVAKAIGWFVAALFAFNVAFIEAVAWVSCIQQLIGNAFMLLALILGIDALEGRGRHRRLLSTLALALAYGSYEQTLAAPAVLAGWYAMRHGVRPAITALRTRLWEWVALPVLYVTFTLGVRGVPDSGPYTMSLGPHVLENLRVYTGLAYHLWVVLPAYGLPSGWTPSHAVWVLVIGVLVWRRRLAELAFGLGTFVVLLLPVLFFKDHAHSFHLYVPALGAWFLAAAAIGALLERAPAAAARTVMASLLIAALMVGMVSSVRVRANVNANISDSVQLPCSFVLRRAVLAQRMRDDILARTHMQHSDGRMILVYPYPQYAANWRNIYSALGQGSGVRLILGSPELDVVFVPPADLPDPILTGDEVMVFTEAGRCYTYLEYHAALERKAQAEGRALESPADTTRVQPVE